MPFTHPRYGQLLFDGFVYYRRKIFTNVKEFVRTFCIRQDTREFQRWFGFEFYDEDLTYARSSNPKFSTLVLFRKPIKKKGMKKDPSARADPFSRQTQPSIFVVVYFLSFYFLKEPSFEPCHTILTLLPRHMNRKFLFKIFFQFFIAGAMFPAKKYFNCGEEKKIMGGGEWYKIFNSGKLLNAAVHI